MIKGNIDPIGAIGGSNMVVVDAELFLTIISKRFRKDTFVLNDFNRKVVRFLEYIKSDFGEVIIGCVNNCEYFTSILEGVLKLNFSVTNFQTEDNYKTWLALKNPLRHLATNDRRYYHISSVYVTDKVINDGIQSYENERPQ